MPLSSQDSITVALIVSASTGPPKTEGLLSLEADENGQVTVSLKVPHYASGDVEKSCKPCKIIWGDGMIEGASGMSSATHKYKVNQIHTVRYQCDCPKGTVYDEGAIDSTPKPTKTITFPSELDVSTYPGPVGNQGGCGACWAFSTVAAVEGAYAKENNAPGSLDLSEQDLVSCSNVGCKDGSYHEYALGYIKSHGIVEDGNMPFVGGSDCPTKPADWTRWTIEGFDKTTGRDDMKSKLNSFGPLVASGFRMEDYDYSTHTCPGSATGHHSVTIVGYSDSKGEWLVRNSYGPSWNGNGLFWVKYGGCNLEDDVRYVWGVKKMDSSTPSGGSQADAGDKEQKDTQQATSKVSIILGKDSGTSDDVDYDGGVFASLEKIPADTVCEECTIYWGDGVIQHVPTDLKEQYHAYDKVGSYSVKYECKCGSDTLSSVDAIEVKCLGPVYDYNSWASDPSRVKHANCYVYACDVDAGNIALPGAVHGIRVTYPPVNCEEYIKAPVADGLVFQGTEGYSCTGCSHPVALFMDLTGDGPYSHDFHWYRRDKDGTWSHKYGRGMPTNLDTDGKVITDPKTAARNFPNNNHETFCGYFCVDKTKVKISGD
jgi:hypothetical protein